MYLKVENLQSHSDTDRPISLLLTSSAGLNLNTMAFCSSDGTVPYLLDFGLVPVLSLSPPLPPLL